jgi:hypothetical protein
MKKLAQKAISVSGAEQATNRKTEPSDPHFFAVEREGGELAFLLT